RTSISEGEASTVATLLHQTGSDVHIKARRLATVDGVPGSVPAGLERIAVSLQGWGDDLQQRLARLTPEPTTIRWTAPSWSAAPPPGTPSPPALRAFALLSLLGAGSSAFALFGAAFGTGPHPLVLDQWLRVEFPTLAALRDRLTGPLNALQAQIESLETDLARIPTASPDTTISATLGVAAASRREDLRNQISDLRRRADRLLAEWAPTPVEVTRYLDSLKAADRDQLLFSVLAVTSGLLPPWLEPYRLAELRRLRTDRAVAAYLGGTSASLSEPAALYMEAVRARSGLASDAEQRFTWLNRLDPQSIGFWAGLSWGVIAGPYAPTRQRSAAGTIGQLIGEVLAGELVVGDVRDLLYDLTHQRYGMAGLDLVGFFPFLGSAKHGDQLAAMVRHHDELLDAARRVDPLDDINEQLAGSAEELATYSATLRDAVRGKGDFGLGSATAEEADLLGRAWVGPHHLVSSDGTAWISADGLRQYRPPAHKGRLGLYQANLEHRFVPSGEWQANGHLVIVSLAPGTAP
ncbi:MAG: hypothetical protein ACXW15_10780, partial [Acidimicrobiia bacterium]